MSAEKWSDPEIDMLKSMYGEHKDIKDISQTLGRTEASVRNKAYKLGITNSKFLTPDQELYLKENYESYNLQEISSKLGMDKANVCRAVKRLGIERTGKKKQFTKPYIKKDPEQTKFLKSQVMKEWHKTHEHPKGMKGKTHSNEYRREISDRVKKYWREVTEAEIEARRVKQVNTKIKNGTLNSNLNCSNPYSRTKSGKREDLNNTFFRSAWEANYARYLNFSKVKWEFEPKTFYFKDIKRGCVYYTPDFYLPETDQWVEVKGWMDDKSKTKLKRFKKFFPEEFSKLILITKKEYKEIEKWKALIPGWE